MGYMITPCFTPLHAINKDDIIEPHPTSSVRLVYIYHNSLKLFSHIHDFYQDLNTTKLDLKVRTWSCNSLANMQICVE